MKPIFEHRNIFWIAIGFFFLFAGFGCAQYLIVPLFGVDGREREATAALVLLYAAFLAGNFRAQFFIEKLGLRRSLIVGAIPYAAFSVAAALQSSVVLYIAAILVGLGAAMLWNASTQIVNLASSTERIGSNGGLKLTALQLGIILGISCATPFITDKTPSMLLFGIFALSSLLGIACFLGIVEPPAPKLSTVTDSAPHLLAAFCDPQLLVFMPLVFSTGFMGALGCSAITLIIVERFGIEHLGWIAVCYRLGCGASGLITGYLSDRFGGAMASKAVLLLLVISPMVLLSSRSAEFAMVAVGLIAIAATGSFPPFLKMMRESLPDSKQNDAINANLIHGNLGCVAGFLLALLIAPSQAVLVGAVFALLSLPTLYLVKRRES